MARIPFISSGTLFKRFLAIESTTPIAFSADNSFDKSLMGQSNDQAAKGNNPFGMAERGLTDSVPPKNTRMTLQGEQPQPYAPFEYNSTQ